MNTQSIQQLINKLIDTDGKISFDKINHNDINLMIEQLQHLKQELISIEGVSMINELVNKYCVPSENRTYFRSDQLSELKQFSAQLSTLCEEIEHFNQSAESLELSSDSVSGSSPR